MFKHILLAVCAFYFASMATLAGEMKCSCCTDCWKVVHQARAAVAAPELIGQKDSEKLAYGIMNRGNWCTGKYGDSEDGKGHLGTVLCNLLGGGGYRCGDVKSCMACGPCCMPCCSAGVGDNVFVSCTTPAAATMCSCGRVKECDICLLGFGGGCANDSEDKLGKDGWLAWLCCFGIPVPLVGKEQ